MISSPLLTTIRTFASINTLFLRKIAPTATEETLRATFAKHGTITKIGLPVDMRTGTPKG